LNSYFSLRIHIDLLRRHSRQHGLQFFAGWSPDLRVAAMIWPSRVSTVAVSDIARRLQSRGRLWI
jgi:hypothetical protein